MSLKKAVMDSESSFYLPKSYFNKRLSIIPLRFVWTDPNADSIRASFERFIQVSWTWFMKPIVASKVPLIEWGYKDGTCPISESVGQKMVNIPCNIPMSFELKLANLIRESLK
jgi:hypothetical protein